MVDISQPFVIDNAPSERFPVYTRANTGEVAGGVITPLRWTLNGGMVVESAWRRALEEFGAFDETEFRPDVLDIQGVFHGYIYINLSVQRVFGVRMPGASADLMDRTYLGDVTAPAYAAQPDDDRPEYTDRILASVGRVMSERDRPDITSEDREEAARLRAARPDLTALGDRELLEHAQAVVKERYGSVLQKHLRMVYESSIVTGALDELAADLGDPTLAVRLTGGLGDIASAAPSQVLWDLSRLIVQSPALTAEFERGVDGLDDRLRASTDSAMRRFVESFDRFCYEFGSRSTDEWAPMPKTWESHHGVPLGMIDRLRLQDESKNPQLQSRRLRQDREALIGTLRTRHADDAALLARIESVLATTDLYMRAREQSKTNTVRVLHEARMPLFELARRFVERGLLARADDLNMLTVTELEDLLAAPGSYTDRIAERREWIDRLDELEPPFIIDGEIPPVTEWPEKKAPAISMAAPGDVLEGIGAVPEWQRGLRG